ncbi:hypothetical protein [Candidatus Williamhamiltonella defendens]|nr:hypothetical protein [Candidatus Hamiltonella defensa]
MALYTVKGKKIALRGLMARRQQEKSRFETVTPQQKKSPVRSAEAIE